MTERFRFMDYLEFQDLLSKPRLDRYKTACKGNEEKTIELYLLNIEISKDFYGILSLFEVSLRNAINKHYKEYFNDENWLINQERINFFHPERKFVLPEYNKLVADKVYTPDKLMSVLTFGIWTDMFSSYCFAKGNQTLLKIFPNRQKGINQKQIHKNIKEIKNLRNKIAHHEPICLDKNNVSTDYAESILAKTLTLFEFLGVSENVLCKFNNTENNLKKLKDFQEN